jgi:hypothetical protein
MKMEVPMVLEHQGELMDGTLDHPKTVIIMICIMSLKHTLTIYPGQQNCSRSTVNFPT